MRSFKSWIKRFKDDDTPFGDLALDIKYDKKFPDSLSRKRCLNHLIGLHASDGAIDTFEEAFQEYEEYKKIAVQLVEK